MHTLMLLRHAKAGEPGIAMPDAERDLTSRGRRAAQAVGRHMAAKGLIPQLVLCSPAKRAHETWRLAAQEIGAAPPMIVDPALYDFGDGGMLLECLRGWAGASTSVLIVGHNPSIETLARRLTASGDRKLRARLDAKYPTGTLAVLTFDVTGWSQLEGGGRLAEFVRPKDLMSDP